MGAGCIDAGCLRYVVFPFVLDLPELEDFDSQSGPAWIGQSRLENFQTLFGREDVMNFIAVYLIVILPVAFFVALGLCRMAKERDRAMGIEC